ncbi:MAG: MFS transporter [Anaerolineae bacterium]|nr:MFS transporter [Anaerolineae bacterium]
MKIPPVHPSTSTVRHTPFFYGWVVVAVCFFTQVVGFGTQLSFGVFFNALIGEFGWSRAETSLIFSATMITFTLFSAPAGLLLQRYGARMTFSAGMALAAVGLLLCSRASTLWHLLAAYGVITAAGLTLINFGPQATVISHWFRRRRGLAIGIVFGGTGIGSMLVTPLVSLIISISGWRAAYLVTAIMAAVAIPLAALLLRDHPRELGLHPDGDVEPGRPGGAFQFEGHQSVRDVLMNPAFWLVMLAAVFTMGPLRLMTVHQITAFTDAGFDRQVVANSIGVAGAVAAATFILSGILSDRVGRQTTFAVGSISLFTAIALLVMLQPGLNPAWLGLYALIFGIGEGARASMVSASASDLFSGPQMALVNGAVAAFFSVGAGLFPWLGGVIYDSQGSYALAFSIGGACIVLSIAAMWLAPRVIGRGKY